jgi:Lon-like ATP-dependent protease
VKLKIGKRTINFNNPFRKSHKNPILAMSPRKSVILKKTSEWDWNNWTSTEGFPVSDNLMDWVIGQDQAMRECKLCLDEWMHKLEYLKKQKWWKPWEKPENAKPMAKELPSGPFLLLLGDAGTGKSLLGRALAFHLDYLYKKHKVKLCDVVTWKNDVIPSEPRISVHPTPQGKEIIYTETHKIQRKSFLQRWGMKILRLFLGVFGAILIGISFYIIVTYPYGFLNGIIVVTPLILGGASLFFFAVMMGYFGRMFGGNTGNLQGIGGASSSNAPKLLIDNSNKKAPFIDGTGHGSAQLFGSIAWDPYQTGGLGTPEHQRVTAGDVHRSHLGILYIDEIKNLTGAEAITLLTVLEDGQLSIALRSMFHGGDTSAMAVSTEPIPCMNFFIAAGNFDSINQIHIALMDRIVGYGKVVRMNNEMPNTEENRRKYVQFISQEIKRFNLLPFDREACETIIDEGRRRSGYNDKLTVKLRPMISIIKTASVLAMNEGLSIVNKKHVNEATQEHCKSIQKQLLEYFVGRRRPFIYIDVDKEPMIGQIAGLSVSEYAEEEVGEVALLKASIVKMKKPEGKDNSPLEGSFEVSGAARPDKAEWITDSIKKVRHVIHSRFGIDLRFGYDTMIDFQQEYGADGPSAGITMTLALVSVLLNKKIRQDVAVTGEITVDQTGKIIITPIGGTDAKIRAAEYWGYKKVVIPKRNYDHSINPSDYKISVVGAETLEDYMKEVMED